MINIAILKKDNSFLPEAEAYYEYFNRIDFIEPHVVSEGDYRPSQFDAVILFHGLHPFWKQYSRLVIGEYHSLSTGRFSRAKDVAKRLLNVKSDIKIFLSQDIRRKMYFRDGDKCLYRPMGYFSEWASKIKEASSTKKYDAVYCGSLRGGVEESLLFLADLGLKIVVVGGRLATSHRNIDVIGKVPHKEIYSILASAKYGINYTPDRHPWNIQDSTKVIEYCALGLGVITNRYSWVCEFEKSRGAKFLYMDDISAIRDIKEFNFFPPEIGELDWFVIMEKSRIVDSIRQCLAMG